MEFFFAFGGVGSGFFNAATGHEIPCIRHYFNAYIQLCTFFSQLVIVNGLVSPKSPHKFSLRILRRNTKNDHEVRRQYRYLALSSIQLGSFSL